MSKRKRDKMKRKEQRHQARGVGSEVNNQHLQINGVQPARRTTEQSSSGLAVDELSHLKTMSPEWRKLYEAISTKARLS